MAKKYPLSGGSGMRAGFPRTSLSSMDDITVNNPQPGEGLVWNGTNWENAVISGGGSSNIVYFMSTADGTLPLYKLLNPAITSAGAPDVILKTVKASTSPVLMQQFVSAELGKTVLQGGIWKFKLYAKANIITGATRLKVIVSTIATGGGSETVLFTCYTEPIDSTTVHPLTIETPFYEVSGLLATDKLKVEVYAETDSVTDIDVTFTYGDNTNVVSRVETPFIINHADLSGLDYTVDGHTGHITFETGQIDALGEKTHPVDADEFIIEDSESSFAKKKTTLSDMWAVSPSLSWKNPVISIFDNTDGLPAGSTGDRYIAKVTANGWIKNHIYEYIRNNFAPSDMTGPDLPAPYVAWASHEVDTNYAWKAFSGQDAYVYGLVWLTIWQQLPAYIAIDLGAGRSKKLSSYSFVSYETLAPKDWTVHGSNDNINWDLLDTVTDSTTWGADDRRTFECDVSIASYRYFKINITAANGHLYYVTLYGVRLYD